ARADMVLLQQGEVLNDCRCAGEDRPAPGGCQAASRQKAPARGPSPGRPNPLQQAKAPRPRCSLLASGWRPPMNLKTTLALVVLVACGAGLLYLAEAHRGHLDLPAPIDPFPVTDQAEGLGSREVLEGLHSADFRRIEVTRKGETTRLDRAR